MLSLYPFYCDTTVACHHLPSRWIINADKPMHKLQRTLQICVVWLES